MFLIGWYFTAKCSVSQALPPTMFLNEKQLKFYTFCWTINIWLLGNLIKCISEFRGLNHKLSITMFSVSLSLGNSLTRGKVAPPLCVANPFLQQPVHWNSYTHICTQSNEGLANEFSQQINYILQTFIPKQLKKWAGTFKEMFFFFLNLSLNWNP